MISIMLFGLEEIFFVYILGKISDRAFRLGVLYIKLKKNYLCSYNHLDFYLFK